MSKEIEKRGDLKASISALYELELNNYLMERTIHTLDEKIPKLGIPQQLIPPKKEVNKYERDGCVLTILGFLFAFLGWGIGVIIGALVGSADGMMAGGLLGILLGLVACAILNTLWEKRVNKEVEAETELKYKKEYGLYLRKVESENKRLERENTKKEELINERNLLIQRRDSSKSFMTEMYNATGIDSKFRTLVRIGYMEEYARLGVADKLGGRDGLYLLVEEKIDREILKIQLSDIINNLNNLVGLHEDIRYELNQMNRKSDEMISLMERSVAESDRSNEINEEIRENSAAAAYNIERMRREEEIRDMLR